MSAVKKVYCANYSTCSITDCYSVFCNDYLNNHYRCTYLVVDSVFYTAYAGLDMHRAQIFMLHSSCSKYSNSHTCKKKKKVQTNLTVLRIYFRAMKNHPCGILI